MDLKMLGARIVRLRRAMGLTQGELADSMGVRRQQVSVWENGHQHISTPNLLRLYDVLGVTPEEFWDEDYIPDSLFANKEAPTTGGVIGAGVPKVDDNGRAITCPRCKYDEHSDIAVYCAECAFPLFNLCSNEERHRNVPSAKFCELCGAKTYWGMDEQELQEHGIPPLS